MVYIGYIIANVMCFYCVIQQTFQRILKTKYVDMAHLRNRHCLCHGIEI